MKLRHYLGEGRLSNKDIGMLKRIINNPKNGSITIDSLSKVYSDDDRSVDVKRATDGVEFSYNENFYELTKTLVDIVDDIDDKEFEVSGRRGIATFKVYV